MEIKDILNRFPELNNDFRLYILKLMDRMPFPDDMSFEHECYRPEKNNVVVLYLKNGSSLIFKICEDHIIHVVGDFSDGSSLYATLDSESSQLSLMKHYYNVVINKDGEI